MLLVFQMYFCRKSSHSVDKKTVSNEADKMDKPQHNYDTNSSSLSLSSISSRQRLT